MRQFTSVGGHGNEQLLWLSRGLGDLGLLVKVLSAYAVWTRLLQVTFGTSVPIMSERFVWVNMLDDDKNVSVEQT